MDDDLAVLHGALESQGLQPTLYSRIHMLLLLSELSTAHGSITCVAEVAVFETEWSILTVFVTQGARGRRLLIKSLNLVDAQKSRRYARSYDVLSSIIHASICIFDTAHLFAITDAWLRLRVLLADQLVTFGSIALLVKIGYVHGFVVIVEGTSHLLVGLRLDCRSCVPFKCTHVTRLQCRLSIFLHCFVTVCITWWSNVATVEIKNIRRSDVFAVEGIVPLLLFLQGSCWRTVRLLVRVFHNEHVLALLWREAKIIAALILLHFQILVYMGKCCPLLTTVLHLVAR